MSTDTLTVRNVVIFGKIGVGVSSLVNLIIGRPDAPVSPDTGTCTKAIAAYVVTIGGQEYRLIDTPGCNPTCPKLRAIRKLEELWGVDLVINCVGPTRGDLKVGKAYQEVRDALPNEVPMVVVVTGLEKYGDEMEDWWPVNGTALRDNGMAFTDYACITTLPDPQARSDGVRQRIIKSRQDVEVLIGRNCQRPKRLGKSSGTPFSTSELRRWWW